MKISDLPRELIEDILALGDPIEMSKMAQCCRLFRDIVYFTDDASLWRNLYLSQPLDDPRICISQDGRPRPPIDWKSELKRIVRARTIAVAIEFAKPQEHTAVLQTFLDMTNKDNISNNLIWVAAILRRGFLDEEVQLVARLHTYFGITHADLKPQARVRSRAFVYDMRKYTAENEYGPFHPDRSVDWVHVQMIHHAVSMHIVDTNEIGEGTEFEYFLFPMSLPSTQIILEDGVDLDTDKDWAGVTGRWAVSFCFCDHRELLKVFRSLAVDITILRTEHDPKHPDRPIIHFVGKMKDPSSSTITGSARMIEDGQVKWHFVSPSLGFAVSEGVQVGGIRSAYGVLGAWTTIFHDRDDPVGPFWLRKLHNEDNLEDILQQLLT
ncbi:hypothetical protein BDQ17DRAFT_1342684 [Cyathus striatus]|nr:hypothetical protein BDQ17DRAFT_1342684 [Cyathus striatus]